MPLTWKGWHRGFVSLGHSGCWGLKALQSEEGFLLSHQMEIFFCVCHVRMFGAIAPFLPQRLLVSPGSAKAPLSAAENPALPGDSCSRRERSSVCIAWINDLDDFPQRSKRELWKQYRTCCWGVIPSKLVAFLFLVSFFLLKGSQKGSSEFIVRLFDLA